MAASDMVKIVEVIQVPPCSNSPKSAYELTLPLTLFDTFWIKFPPVERIFFYELTELTPTFFHSVILPNLKSSLSLTLLHFLPLAGHITWPPDSDKPIVCYVPNDGVSLTVSKSTGDFDYLSSNKVREAIDSHPYIPKLPSSDSKASIFALQVTLFANQGFCIGVSSHHAFLDGKSSSMFMKAWAHICKQSEQEHPGSLPPELTPFFDRTVIQDPEGIDMEYLNNWKALNLPDGLTGLKVLPMMGSPAFVRQTFELSCEDIKKLREKVLLSSMDKAPKEDPNLTKPIRLSTFVITYAYVIICIVKAKGLKSNRKVLSALIADCRARLDPPIPANYFGNCVTSTDVITEAGVLMEENGISFAAEKLMEAIKGLEKGIVEEAKGKLARYMGMKPGEAVSFSIAGSPRFGFYGVDFGWGRPKKVEVTSIEKTEAISMAESRDGSGGVEIGLVLNKREMEKFDFLFVNGLKDL